MLAYLVIVGTSNNWLLCLLICSTMLQVLLLIIMFTYLFNHVASIINNNNVYLFVQPCWTASLKRINKCIGKN